MNKVASNKGVLRRIPPFVLRPLHLVPSAVIRPLVEAGLRRFFKQSIEGDGLEILEGRQVLLSVTDISLDLMITVRNGQPRLNHSTHEPELTISGNLEEFVLLASNREDPDTQFFQRRITIEGDTELGLEVKNLIYSLDPDRLPIPVTKLLDHLGWIIETTRSRGL